MPKVILYCDESGAKGYADQDEAYPGEVGVFAGIMVPDELLATTRIEFDRIAAHYATEAGKLHIADLVPSQQEALRTDLFAAIRSSGLPCFWYAIHVAGLHAHHHSTAKLLESQKEAQLSARGGQGPRVKGSSPRVEAESMHVVLFGGLYSHLVAYMLERERQQVEIEIRTDQVDTPIVRRFVEVAEELLRTDPLVARATGFDTVEQRVVSGSVTASVKLPSELEMSSVVSGLSIKTVPDSDGLVLAADVLANSLNYLFKGRDADSRYGPLNCRDAIADHPLTAHLDAFNDWGSGDCLGDGIYRHPKSRH